MSSLCDDMLVEVLTRLPLRSFSRSRCVSKSWCDLASDDHVRNKLPLIVSGVLAGLKDVDGPTYVSTTNSTQDSMIRPVDLGFLLFRSDSTLVDCCNGLLLFYSSLTSSFHVCSPTTRKFATLPKPTSERKTLLLSVVLFDPYRSRHFKVVNFVRWLARGAELEVFDSELGEWLVREVLWGVDTVALTATMRYADGILYVLSHPKQMVAVGLDTMTCDVIELPEDMRVESCVGKLGGRLHYSVSDGREVRVWMLKEEGDQEYWVLKQYCVGIEMGEFRMMGFNPEREVVYMCVGSSSGLVAYDLCEARVEEVWELGQEGEKLGHLMHVWVFPFAKNLEDLLS